MCPGQGSREALRSGRLPSAVARIPKAGRRTPLQSCTAATATQQNELPAANACQAPLCPPAIPTMERRHLADISLNTQMEGARTCSFRPFTAE